MFNCAAKILNVIINQLLYLAIVYQNYLFYLYLCFPSMGLNPMITLAKADFTCWFGSATSSLTMGNILVIIMDS